MPKKKSTKNKKNLNKKHSTLKQFIFHTLDILLITLTIVAVLLVFKNPFSANIDAYVNYGFLGILFMQFLLAEKSRIFSNKISGTLLLLSCWPPRYSGSFAYSACSGWYVRGFS